MICIRINRPLELSTFLAIALQVAVVAQSPRPSMPAHVTYKDGSGSGYVYVAGGGNMLQWQLFSGTRTAVSTSLPIPLVGDATYLGGSKMLFAGADATATTAVLAIVSRVAESVVVEAQATYPGRDFTSLYYNELEGRVYVIDGAQGQCLSFEASAPWSLPSAQSLELVATVLDIPQLGDGPHWLKTHGSPAGSAGVLISDRTGDAFKTPWHARKVGVNWLVGEPAWPSPESRWYFRGGIQNSFGPMYVGGAIGSFLIKERTTGLYVAGGNTTSTEFIELVPTPVLIPGEWYDIESLTPGVKTTSGVFCARWGIPKSSPAVTAMRADDVIECYAGNAQFAISGRFVLTDAARTDSETHDVYVWIGLDLGVPVVEFPDGTATIATLIGTIGPLPTVITNYRGAYYTSLPLPADTGLEGYTVLFQAALLAGNDVVYTDVVGTKVFSNIGLLGGIAGPAALSAWPSSSSGSHSHSLSPTSPSGVIQSLAPINSVGAALHEQARNGN